MRRRIDADDKSWFTMQLDTDSASVAKTQPRQRRYRRLPESHGTRAGEINLQ
jgi:hypothetical protein